MTEKKLSRSGLGRGLSALMADVAQTGTSFGPQDRPAVTLPVERIQPNPNQPRQDFPADAMTELAESIRQKGVVQPLIVRASALEEIGRAHV